MKFRRELVEVVKSGSPNQPVWIVRASRLTAHEPLVHDGFTRFSREVIEAFERLIRPDGLRIVFSFEEIEVFSDVGLATFMADLDRVRARGGDIRVCNLSDSLRNVLDYLGLQQVVEFHNTELDAIESFAATPSAT
jgi:anti-anti-sigma factor